MPRNFVTKSNQIDQKKDKLLVILMIITFFSPFFSKKKKRATTNTFVYEDGQEDVYTEQGIKIFRSLM